MNVTQSVNLHFIALLFTLSGGAGQILTMQIGDVLHPFVTICESGNQACASSSTMIEIYEQNNAYAFL